MSMLTKSTRPSDSIPTSSMADIAFLLLIFFLVTTVFPKDRGLALVLPDATTPVPARNILHLFVLADGLVEVRHGDAPQTTRVGVEQLRGIWRDAVAANPQLIAGVTTSPEAAYHRMVDVLDELHAAGARRVSLQMLEAPSR